MLFAKIKTFIQNWRERAKINEQNNITYAGFRSKKIITSRRTNRKIINMLKKRRNIHRRKRTDFVYDGSFNPPSYVLPAPSAPLYVEEYDII